MVALIRKSHRGTIELKADKPGEFRATFATFNVIDRDGDVTIPGAFKDGQEVRICAWGHNWGALPVGRGVISQDDSKAFVDGAFFLDTAGGADTYKTVKNLGDLQEWSYGFDILEQSNGEFEGRDVRFLRQLDTFEVSPVMVGAGVGTGTDDIKTAKPNAELLELKQAALAFVAAVDKVIGSTEDGGDAKAEAGDAGKAEGDEGVKDGAPVNLLSEGHRLELELLAQ